MAYTPMNADTLLGTLCKFRPQGNLEIRLDGEAIEQPHLFDGTPLPHTLDGWGRALSPDAEPMIIYGWCRQKLRRQQFHIIACIYHQRDDDPVVYLHLKRVPHAV